MRAFKPYLATVYRRPRGQNSGSLPVAGPRGPAVWWPGGRGRLEDGLDGGGDELRGLGIDGDVAAEQHAADDLPGVPGRVLRVGRPCQLSFLR